MGAHISDDAGGSLGARPGQRYLALDSLRGICALLLALFHFHTIGVISNSRVIQHAYLFVEFFFVLSGFVIAASYGGRLRDGFPIGKFMALRLGRVYPLHIFMLALFLAAEMLGVLLVHGLFTHTAFSGLRSIPELLYGVGFIQIFVGQDETGWNAPSWSISAEVWAYIVFAMLFRLSRRLPMAAIALIAASVGGLVYWRFLAMGFNPHHWGALPRCLYGFGLGVFGYQVLPAVRRALAPLVSRKAVATLAELATVAVTIGIVIWNASLFAPVLFCVVVLVFALESGGVSRLLVTAPMLFLGTISYSIYMVHDFVQFRLVNVLTWVGHKWHVPDLVLPDQVIGISPLFADALTLPMLVLVIAAATLTYRFVERPGQRWSRRLILGPGSRSATVTAEREAPTF